MYEYIYIYIYRERERESQEGCTMKYGGCFCFSRRWLQDTSKRKLADFSIFLHSPPSCFPGFTRG